MSKNKKEACTKKKKKKTVIISLVEVVNEINNSIFVQLYF